MDLDEFLSENGIPSDLAPAVHRDQHQSQSQHQTSSRSQAPTTPSPSVIDLSNHASASTLVHTSMGAQNCLRSLTRTALPSRNTPSPIDPESVQVPMSYEPDPADLALSSVPGQEMFDPRKCKFAPEELKPQPMFKKARKVLFPDDMKVCVSSNLSDYLALYLAWTLLKTTLQMKPTGHFVLYVLLDCSFAVV
ncbi:unnamed protein product [Oncorhynchus mykiss]|uniref:Hepatic leukemia factor n=1 Tax=Oncorhynchus mykiss TaxID=8022 RepID=A0A060XMP6_ONCMY|nr:unnamed protein product [Oncorhynchus mykiss]